MSLPLSSGDTISRYRIIGPLGKGGMGVVYEAEDLRLGRKVALKFLPEDRLDDTARKRFLNEARAAAQIRHPHICPMYDVEEVDGRVFLAMAHIQGETLSKRIKSGLLPLSDISRWGAELLSGLEAAHAAGIVHRDIKSSNIMIDDSGRVLILDFGLALIDQEERLTLAGQAVGTLAYMSPEQARGLDVDARSDLWSVGVVLYEMTAGRLPGWTPAPLRDSRPEVTAAMQGVIAKAMCEAPEARWQSAKEMRLALERAASESAVSVAAEDGTRTMALLAASEIPGKKSSWKKWLPAGLLAAVLVLGAVLAIRQYRQTPLSDSAVAVRRIVLLPLTAKGEQAQVLSDGLLEVWATAIADAERGGQKVWVVPLNQVRARKLESPEEARRAFGVEQAIVGTAESQGSNIQIFLQLIDTATLKSIGTQSLVYNPMQAAASRDRAIDQMRTLLTMKAQPASGPTESSRQRGSFGPYLEGRGLMMRYDKAGNLDRAIRRFEEALAQDPNFALAHISLGEAYWLRSSLASGSPEHAAKALSHAKKGVELDDNLALGHAKLGKILAESGDQAQGLREMQRALELSPGNADAYLEMAEIYSRQGKFDEAEKLFQDAIKARPTDWLGYSSLALFYDARGKLAEAETQFRLSGKYAPENAGVMRNLGRIYRMRGKYPEAVQQFQRAISIQPSSRNYNSLGLAYYYMHEYRQAIVATETAIALDDKNHLLWGNLGSACAMSLEDRDKSVPALRKAIELAEKSLLVTPNEYSIMADLAEYRARLGDRKGALAEIQRIPATAQGPLASRLVLAYELSGERQMALETVRANFKTKARLREILDEAAIPKLLVDPEFQKIVGTLRSVE